MNIIKLLMAAGSSEEVLGDELYDTVFTNVGFSPFTTDGLDITAAVNVNLFIPNSCWSDENLDSGKTYRITFTLTLNNGNVSFRTAADTLLSVGLVVNESLTSSGAYEFDSTGTTYTGFFGLSDSFAITDYSVKEIL